MPSLNFMERFSEPVEAGRKRCTVRKPGRAKPGQTAYLFTGLRSSKVRRLGQHLILGVTHITVFYSGAVSLGGNRLSDEQVEELARRDTDNQMGAAEWVDFFRQHYGLPFDGELIAW